MSRLLKMLQTHCPEGTYWTPSRRDDRQKKTVGRSIKIIFPCDVFPETLLFFFFSGNEGEQSNKEDDKEEQETCEFSGGNDAKRKEYEEPQDEKKIEETVIVSESRGEEGGYPEETHQR